MKIKNLYVLCGTQNTGKSTFIAEHQLNHYTLSLEDIQVKLETPTRYITQKHDNKAFKILFELLEYRLANNQTTFIDSLCILNNPRTVTLANKYHYTITIIDFREDNLQELLQRNKKRSGIYQVPELDLINTFNMLQNIEEASTVNRIDPKEFSTQIDPSINLTKYERILVSSDWYDRYAEAKQLLETFKPTEKDVIILLGNYSAKKIHPAEMTQLITDLSNNPQVILLRGSQDKFCPNCKDYLFMEYNQQHYLLTHAPQSNLPTRLTNGNWLNKSMYTDPAQLSTIYTEWENTQKDTIHIHGHNNYWSYDIQPRTNIFNLTSDIEFGGAIRALIITKDSTTALEIPAILKDTQEKPIETTDTHYYNFSTTREGLTNIRLSETYPYNHVLTTYATYLLVDKDKIVLRSFDKLCHLKHLPRSIKKILSFPLSIELKHNGFTGLLGVHNEDFIFKVTSTNEEPYSELFKELLPVFKDSHSELLNTLKGHTLVFEVMHDEANRNPAEAIDSNFLYLLASINNETGVINTKSNTKFVNYINKYGTVAVIPQRVLTTKLHNLEELIEFITLVENSEEGIEGYVIRDQKGFGFKVTTYYYKYKTIDKLTGLNFKNAHNDIT